MSGEEKDWLHQSFEEFTFGGAPDSLARFVCEVVTHHEAWIFIQTIELISLWLIIKFPIFKTIPRFVRIFPLNEAISIESVDPVEW